MINKVSFCGLEGKYTTQIVKKGVASNPVIRKTLDDENQVLLDELANLDKDNVISGKLKTVNGKDTVILTGKNRFGENFRIAMTSMHSILKSTSSTSGILTERTMKTLKGFKTVDWKLRDISNTAFDHLKLIAQSLKKA